MDVATRSNMVCGHFNIDEDELSDRAEQGGYWENSYNFYIEWADSHVDDLSPAQYEWLRKIESGLKEDSRECY